MSWVEIRDFQGCLYDRDLHDAKGFSRIDMVVVNSLWIDLFPESFGRFLPKGVFDHCPCLFQLSDGFHSRPRAFKYYNMAGWSGVVRGTPMFTQKLKATKQALTRAQDELQTHPNDVGISRVERDLAKEVVLLLKARDMFLGQRAKLNKVLQITDMGGVLWTSPSEINKAFEDYYVQLLGRSDMVQDIHVPTFRKGKIVSAEAKEGLPSVIFGAEIKEALFAIPRDKAPGPDGFSSQFYKDSWSEFSGPELILGGFHAKDDD
ncbi:hypothetical protein RND81_07G073500 [Saponaria officinalis]|uniref:Uncharacterized protein n=1 Tax=Saponaria officinalis TaxID=3572 RepID=A0AAW1JPW1_SAPOF